MNTGSAVHVTTRTTNTFTLLATTTSRPDRDRASTIRRPIPAWKAPA